MLEFYYQTDKGWKVGDEKDTESEWEAYVKDSVANIQMFRCRETGERFLYIASIAQEPLEITDSLNTEFVQKGHRYFACIGTVNQGYSLEIDGSPVTIPGIAYLRKSRLHLHKPPPAGFIQIGFLPFDLYHIPSGQLPGGAGLAGRCFLAVR